MILILLMKFLTFSSVLANDCDIECSHLNAPVCGKITQSDGTESLDWYHNVCFLLKIKCDLKGDASVEELPSKDCGVPDESAEMDESIDFNNNMDNNTLDTNETRRIFDFSITGAHQACNHTCPTYCVDTYQPVCAIIYFWIKIEGKDKKKQERRTMVNHCHVDLFSCSVGVNVTITPMNKCFENAQGLQFMSSMAAMKTLGFLNEGRRRSSVADIYEMPGGLTDLSGTSGREQQETIMNGFLRTLLNSLMKKVTRR